MLKLYGRKTSLNVQKVLWTCAELGLAIDHDEKIGGAYGRNRDPEYLAKNPNGLVPLIDDDGFILWESNSIVRYLTSKHRSPLYPLDPQKRAAAEKWMDWRLSVMGGGGGGAGAWPPLYLGLVRTPPEKRNPVAIEEARQKCIAAFRMVEDNLARNTYMGGDALNIGDIPIGAFVYRWMELPIERPSMPYLERYFETLKQRPGYRTHVMIGIE